MLPEGWSETTVGKSCSIKNNIRTPINEDERGKIKGIYPYYGPTGILDYINIYKIDEDFALIGEDGDHFFKYNEKEMTILGSGKASINNHAHVILNSAECLAKWFYLYFMHKDVTRHITRQGAKRYKLNKNSLENIPIILPPLPEQEKIAAILSTWDKAISTTDALLANSRQQKKALMQQLLTGKRRLPGFTGEWKTILLSDIAVRLNERNNGKSDNVVTISAQKGLIRQEEFFNKSIASENLDTYFILHKGQFAYNKSYSIGYPMGAIKRLKLYETGVVTSLYICFDITSMQADANFYEHFFESGLLNAALTKIAAEGGRAHGLLNVRPADFMHISVPLPPLDEQRAIAAVLDAADREIVLLEQKAARLREEKKALMQQLLTGKRRVRL